MKKTIYICDRCHREVDDLINIEVGFKGRDDMEVCAVCAGMINNFAHAQGKIDMMDPLASADREKYFMGLLVETEKAICETLGISAIDAGNIPVTVKEICENFKKLAEKQKVQIHFK